MKKESIATFVGYREVLLPVSKMRIKVRQLPVREFPKLSAVIENEPDIVSLCTGLTEKEVDALHVEDFEELYKVSSEENLRPFSRWVKRRKQTAAVLERIFGPEENPEATSGAAGANT